MKFLKVAWMIHMILIAIEVYFYKRFGSAWSLACAAYIGGILTCSVVYYMIDQYFLEIIKRLRGGE